jgi:hypothetical protein
MFTKEEHNNLLTQLRSAESEADRATIIAQLESDYTDVLTKHDTATQERDSAVAERDKYHNLNNDMWLQLADQRKLGEEQINKGNNNNTTKIDDIPKKLSYADLEAKMMEEFRRN